MTIKMNQINIIVKCDVPRDVGDDVTEPIYEVSDKLVDDIEQLVNAYVDTKKKVLEDNYLTIKTVR